MLRTFSIHTLGCRVNQYEGEQIAALLRARGLAQVEASDGGGADLRVVNTCSVTVEAAAKSRQATRRSTRLPVLQAPALSSASLPPAGSGLPRPRVIVTGCWATSDRPAAAGIAGVDAVLGHHDDIAAELDRLLDAWGASNAAVAPAGPRMTTELHRGKSAAGADVRAGEFATTVKPNLAETVKHNPATIPLNAPARNPPRPPGTVSLPQLGARQATHQRAYLKVQDGCDAHCSYCIIPSLRPNLWSKPVEAAVEEARRLVDGGHGEIVLTGIFLGAYGQPTALRRRQSGPAGGPLGGLVEALCAGVPGLRRLRLSSLEPGDLSSELLAVLRSHAQVVPHFHLPLQSGSDALLRRMNRQYTRDDFCRMVDAVRDAFDQPAFTTDIIVGFPGETDDAFDQTLAVVAHARFIHTHAFPYSRRPHTAAARWREGMVGASVANHRIALLQARAREHSFAFRKQFLGEVTEVMVERLSSREPGMGHGRGPRYFPVHFEADRPRTGELLRVRVTEVTVDHTRGELLDP